jgi:hypothetical protein
MADIEFEAELYINKKHNTEYFAFDKLEITDATNETNGRKMKLYFKDNNWYVREVNEFNEKFYKKGD